MINNLKRVSVAGFIAAALMACTSNDIKDDEFFEPAELLKFEETVELKKNWSVSLSGGQGKRYVRLEPFYTLGHVYAASSEGIVTKLDVETGKPAWRVKTKLPISGGVAMDRGQVLLGTLTGEVVALSDEDGSQLWKAQLSSEVLSSPRSDGSVIVVHCYDGKVYGLKQDNGEKIWEYDSQQPRLTLRGTSAPVMSGGLAIIALANGKIVALHAETGIVQWEQRVTIAQGRSEIERIVDIEGTPLLDGSLLFAVTYQGQVAVLEWSSGRLLWRKEASSYVSVAQGFGNIYISETDGKVSAYKVNDGSLQWQQEDLAWRKLSPPATIGSYMVVGDYDGYLHLLSQSDGTMAGRERIDGSGVRVGMLSVGSALIVYSNGGKLVSYGLRE